MADIENVEEQENSRQRRRRRRKGKQLKEADGRMEVRRVDSP